MIPGRRAGLAVAFVTLMGCSAYHRLRPPYPATFPPDQVVEVWRAGHRTALVQVRIDSATVLGLTRRWPPLCDSCRVAIPIAQVDSLVLENHEAVGILGGTVVLIVLWILDHCWPYAACMD